jgi:RNA polymerase primary sigma factor
MGWLQVGGLDAYDVSTQNPEDTAMSRCLRGVIDNLLEDLDLRASEVLRLRFGIGMESDYTLEEVGQKLGVTRERIRQIEAKALLKLRHVSRSEILRCFLDNPDTTNLGDENDSPS